MIAIEARVTDVIIKIDADPEFWPVAEPGDGFLYLFDTSQKIFGTIQYTMFNAQTLFPEASWAVKYGTQHYIHQVLYSGTMTRTRLTHVINDVIPGSPREEFNPMIIPYVTASYPTEVIPSNPNRTFI
jgi:hypothetical protein